MLRTVTVWGFGLFFLTKTHCETCWNALEKHHLLHPPGIKKTILIKNKPDSNQVMAFWLFQPFLPQLQLIVCGFGHLKQYIWQTLRPISPQKNLQQPTNVWVPLNPLGVYPCLPHFQTSPQKLHHKDRFPMMFPLIFSWFSHWNSKYAPLKSRCSMTISHMLPMIFRSPIKIRMCSICFPCVSMCFPWIFPQLPSFSPNFHPFSIHFPWDLRSISVLPELQLHFFQAAAGGLRHQVKHRQGPRDVHRRKGAEERRQTGDPQQQREELHL